MAREHERRPSGTVVRAPVVLDGVLDARAAGVGVAGGGGTGGSWEQDVDVRGHTATYAHLRTHARGGADLLRPVLEGCAQSHWPEQL